MRELKKGLSINGSKTLAPVFRSERSATKRRELTALLRLLMQGRNKPCKYILGHSFPRLEQGPDEKPIQTRLTDNPIVG
jgi:hypothetical protein